jgi:hypothetical protein
MTFIWCVVAKTGRRQTVVACGEEDTEGRVYARARAALTQHPKGMALAFDGDGRVQVGRYIARRKSVSWGPLDDR